MISTPPSLTCVFTRPYLHLLLAMGLIWLTPIQPSRAQSIQNYPVQTSAFLPGPASQRLADYFSSDKRLLIDLLLKDLTKNNILVYLNWAIEGPGIRVQSRPGYIPPQLIALQRGVPNRLRGSDLQAAYFNPDAIQTQGIDPRSVYTIELPEGFYTLNVQAIEAATGQVVSNLSETYLVLAYPQPPIINLPSPGSEVPITSLQKVPISWAPRHFATPTTNAVYNLKVCQVPDQFDPNELVMLTCTEPRLDITLPATSMAPDITQWIKPLEVGQRYALQVTVSDLSGELTNFVNQGRSQVSWFRYGRECLPPVFSIQSLGTDRVQLSWARSEGAQGYVVEYKLATAATWQTMLVSGTSQVIGSLNPTADYVFRMRTDCGGSAPSGASELQSWNIREEAPAVAPELPLALTNPVAIRVQTGVDGQAQGPTSLSALYSNYPPAGLSGAMQSGPGGSTDPTSATSTTTQGVTNTQPSPSTTPTAATGLPSLTLPYCALQASSFAGCDIPHPSVGLPTGERELTSLKVGDVLGIYDYAVFVTRVGGGTPLSGEGLARLPFLHGTMVLVEFSGVSAKAGEEGSNGGCVYSIAPEGYFRIRRTTQDQVQSAQRGLIAQVLNRGNPTAGVFVGSLGDALAKYDSTVQVSGLTQPGSQTLSGAIKQVLVSYVSAIEQGSQAIRAAFEPVYGGSTEPLVVSIRDSLAGLMSQLSATLTALQSGTAVAGLSALTVRYQALFDQLHQFTNPTTPIPITPTLSPVVLSGLSDNSARLSWQGDPSFTKYVVHYTLEGGGELLQTVTTPAIQLLNLQAGANYAYTIEGYQGTNQVSRYGAPFTTLPKTIPPPVNLAYTVQDDNTVTITWDKNKAHQRFQLVYTDQAGVDRTLYPSTNQATLTGLDPSQHYTYQVVAYNNTLSSEPAGGRLASTPACALNVDDRNATNWSAVRTNEHLLLASGCIGGKLSWSNGTPGTVANGLLTWADGETGQIGGLFLGDHALVVAPQRNTTYTAICQMGGGGSTSGVTQKSCTYSVTVRVSSPECQGAFQISASTTTVEKGEVVTLTASGCSGQLSWSQGLGNQSTVRLVPTTNAIVSAVCTTGNTICYATPVSLKIQPSCIASLYVTDSHLSTYGDGFLGPTKYSKNLNVRYVGCEDGTVSWSMKGEAKEASVIKDYYTIQRIVGPITVSAVCKLPGQEACRPISLSIEEPCIPEYALSFFIDTPYRITTPAGFTAIYGITTADNKNILLVNETGASVNTQPARGVSVPLLAKDKVYKATFPPTSCTAYLNVPGRASNPPLLVWTEQSKVGKGKVGQLTAQSTVIDAFDLKSYSGYDPQYRLNMSVSNCTGKLVWTNDQDPTFRMEVAQVDFSDANKPTIVPGNLAYLNFPAVTTTYYATCSITNPDGSQEVYQATHPKTILITSDACMRLDVATPSVTKGQPVKLTAVGCTGDVSWSAAGQLVGVGARLMHTPVPSTTPSAYVYTARCHDLACEQSVTVQIKNCQFTISAAKLTVKIAEQVTLTTAGCDGGLVQWGTGQEGASITVKPLENTLYTADCRISGVVACRNTIDLRVESSSPIDVNCPPFQITSDNNSVTRCLGSPITITPSGCPAGSLITWSDGTTSGPTEPKTMTLSQQTTITATCTTPYQIAVRQSLRISTIEPSLQIISTDVYAGFPAILRATGCYGADCQEGTYRWLDANGRYLQTGSSLTVSILQSTTYQVTCNNASPKSVSVKLKNDEACNKGFQLDNASGLLNKSQAYLSASWCDANYDIRWTKTTFINGTTTSEFSQGRGKQRFIVERPPLYQFYLDGKPFGAPTPQRDDYTVYCVRNEVPCQYYVYSVLSHDPTAPDLPNTYVPNGPVDPSSTPDACSPFVGVDKGGSYGSPRGPQYNTYELFTDWCTNGRVNWYKDGSQLSQLVFGPQASSPAGIFHYVCTLSGGKTCEGDYQFTTPSPQGGRVAAPVPGVSTPDGNTCSPSIALAVAMQEFYQQMLCQLSNLILTKDDAQAVLSSLQQQLSGTGVVFPTDLSAVADALVAPDCQQAAKLLAAANGITIIDDEVFNGTIKSQFAKIQSRIKDVFGAKYQVLGETIQNQQLKIIVSVNAADKNEIDDSQEQIALADKRFPIPEAEDRQSGVNKLPVEPDAQNYFREICAVWDASNQPAYAEYLGNLFTTPTSIREKITQLENQPLLFPNLVQQGTLGNLSEGFLKTFFLNKIKGYSSEVTGLKSLYTGSNKTLYESVAVQLLNHFYAKTATDYFQTKVIADAIYKTEVGNRRIDNMIKIVDGLFFSKIGNLSKLQDSDPAYYKKDFVSPSFYIKSVLDKDWFDDICKYNVFPSFGALDAISLNNAPPGAGDEERLGLYTFGGTQGIDVRVKTITPILTPTERGYEATIVIRYLDTFGVDESDYAKDLPGFNLTGLVNWARFNYRGGVLANWLLQHQYGYPAFTDYLTYIINMKHIWPAN